MDLLRCLQATIQKNLDRFFNDFKTSLSQASEMYDNFVVKGDFNIDVNLPSHTQY